MPEYDYFIQQINDANKFSGIVGFLVGIFMIICKWKINKKTKMCPGWWALIPLLDFVGTCRIAYGRKRGWYALFLFLPFVTFPLAGFLPRTETMAVAVVMGTYAFVGIFLIVTLWRFVRAFEKGLLYFLGMIFLPFIVLPIFAYGNHTFVERL